MSRIPFSCGNQDSYIDMVDFELAQLRVSVRKGSDDERDDVTEACECDHLARKRIPMSAKV